MSESEETGSKPVLNREDLSRPLVPRKVRVRVPKYLDKASGESYFFTKRALRFMEVYSAEMDLEKALKDSGMTLNQVKKNDYLMAEVRLINENFRMQHRSMNAKSNHQRLMNKFEASFDDAGRQQKPAFASTLARMSEAAMKAEGEFNDDDSAEGGVSVMVNINLGEQHLEKTENTLNVGKEADSK